MNIRGVIAITQSRIPQPQEISHCAKLPCGLSQVEIARTIMTHKSIPHFIGAVGVNDWKSP